MRRAILGVAPSGKDDLRLYEPRIACQKPPEASGSRTETRSSSSGTSHAAPLGTSPPPPPSCASEMHTLRALRGRRCQDKSSSDEGAKTCARMRKTSVASMARLMHARSSASQPLKNHIE